ncbi:MAG: hypothetical protein HY853_00705, partial [Burkholderiales bacterium]|nr:hypothetical protein [Burkholderiales bacterium]
MALALTVRAQIAPEIIANSSTLLLRNLQIEVRQTDQDRSTRERLDA